MDDDLIASTWLENCRDAIAFGSDSDEANASFWAYSALDQLCSSDPDRALQIIRLILAMKPEERVVYNLAAGPLEDLLTRHGKEVIDRVDQLANQDDAFLKLVGGVWPDGMSPEIQNQIRSLIDKAESRDNLPH